jgi:chorismate mutase
VSDDRLGELRLRVLATDRQIVAAVNERVRLVAEIWAIKIEEGLPLVDAEREQLLRDALAEANAGPLSRAELDALLDTILGLTKREVRRLHPRAG